MKTFHVSGYAFVPHRFKVVVTAKTPDEAKKKAIEQFKETPGELHVNNSHDVSAAFDWCPSIEEMNQIPNEPSVEQLQNLQKVAPYKGPLPGWQTKFGVD